MRTFVVAVDSDAGRIAAVSYRRRRKGLYPRKLVLLDELTGRTLWVSSRRSRQFVSGVPWSSPFALRRDSFLYLSKRGRLFALEFDRGASLWHMKAPHGFVIAGTNTVVGADTPYLYDPENGTRKSWKDVRIHGPMAQSGPVVVARLADGTVAGFTPDGTRVWSIRDEFDPRSPIVTVPYADGVSLLRIVYPKYLATVKLRTGSWEVELPGTPKGDPFVWNGLATYLLNDTRKFRSIATVDLGTGSLLCSTQVDADACTGAGGMVVCRKGRTLHAWDQKSCNLLKSLTFSKTIRFVAMDGATAALQLADGRISLVTPAEGTILFTEEIRIKGAPVRLRDVMDMGSGITVILVRTVWADKPRLDRIYALVYDARMGRIVREVKLGKPVPPFREARYVEGPQRVKMRDPVWKHEGYVISCLWGLCQAIDPGTGRARRAFVLPGRGPASLVSLRPDGTALVERGNLLVAVTGRPSIRWQASIRQLEARLITRRWAFYGNLDELVVLDLSTGRRVSHTVPPGYAPVAATDTEWYFRTSRGGVIYRNAKPKKGKVPYRYDLLPGLDGLLYASSRKVPTRGVWYGMDDRTGAVLYKKAFSGHPPGSGLARDLSAIEPREDSFSPMSWISSCDRGFLVPDPSHRCLYLIAPRDGSVRWSHCFFRLGGPPLVRGDWILLPAVGPHGPAGKPPRGDVPEGEGRLSVYAVDARTGKAWKVYEPEPPYSVMMPLRAHSLITVTLYEEGKVKRSSIVVGLRFISETREGH